MWYFAWSLGTLLACAAGIIAVLLLESRESEKENDSDVS